MGNTHKPLCLDDEIILLQNVSRSIYDLFYIDVLGEVTIKMINVPVSELGPCSILSICLHADE